MSMKVPRQTADEGKQAKCIFYQKSKALQNEFALIQLVTLREEIKNKLEKVVKDVKLLSRPCDFACMLETFRLINQMRDATFNLVDGVDVWQQGFTRNIRPQLMNIDYLIVMITSSEFFSASVLRKMFNFQLGTLGNFLLLPLPNPRMHEPVKVPPVLAAEIELFANPIEHRLVRCYQILLNCMSTNEFRRILPIEQWISTPWKPRLAIIEGLAMNKSARDEDRDHHGDRREGAARNRSSISKNSKDLTKSGKPKRIRPSDPPATATMTEGSGEETKAQMAQTGGATAGGTSGDVTAEGSLVSSLGSSPAKKGNKFSLDDIEPEEEVVVVVTRVKTPSKAQEYARERAAKEAKKKAAEEAETARIEEELRKRSEGKTREEKVEEVVLSIEERAAKMSFNTRALQEVDWSKWE